MAYEESREPLSISEHGQLRGGLWAIGLFTLFCIGIFTFMLHLVVSNDGWSGPGAYIVLAVALLFASVIAVQLKRVLDDLDLGQAAVLRGPVSGKSEYTRRSKRGRRTFYYLHLGTDRERRIEVDPGQYNRVSEGDRVEIRQGPRSKKLFALRVLERAAREDASPRHAAPASRPVPAEVPMTDADTKALRRSLFRRMRNRLVGIAFCTYFLFYFVWEGLWGIVLLFFPVPLLFLYNVLALGRALWLYLADKNGGTKTALVLELDDRSTARSRGKRHLLHFGRQRLEVEQALFEKTAVGEQFVVYTGKRSGWLLGIEPTTPPAPD